MAERKAPRTAAAPGNDAEPLEELFARLGSSPEGLSEEEARDRLASGGPNALPEQRTPAWRVLLGHFWGPIAWMIEIAAVLSALVRDWTDFAIILTLLLVNALVGFWEEYKAGNDIAALQAQLAPSAQVRRSGRWRSLDARQLVPGDVVRLRIGSIIPADARLIGPETLEVDQSALTGESLPVERSGSDPLLSGSIVRQGEADALITATGESTFFGRTARLVETTHHTSHFQRAVLKIGDYLIALAMLLVVLILGVALFRGDGLIETLKFVLVLTVASIPVAMPTVLSVTLAVGAERMARRRAIVRRLAAIEELAGIDVLCSDKTGTLTLNQLTLGDPWPLPGGSPEELVRAAARASRQEDDDPIDRAVLEGLRTRGLSAEVERIEAFQPFDPVVKRTEARLLTSSGERLRVSKGAPQVILRLCRPNEEQTMAVRSGIDDLARRGYRCLGVAEAAEGQPWRFLGLLPLQDPPRPDVQDTLDRLRQLGVRIRMITGDQLAIAREISTQLGLGAGILRAAELGEPSGGLSAERRDLVEQADGFAEVFPEHKYRIVETLQGAGHIVGMTGDGVNDAPALKRADAGIAVSGSTDAARSAADIVLLTPGLSVIVDAIRESRRIFQRMTHYAIYRIAETIRVLTFMTLSILAYNFYPVSAVMIVLLAILNDGAILSIAYDRVSFARHPVRWNMPEVLGVATSLGLAGVISSFGLLYLAEIVLSLPRPLIQTLLYLKLSVAGHLTVFASRTRGPFWSVRPARVLLLAVVLTQLLATAIAVRGVFMEPISWWWAVLVWGYSLLGFLLEDRVKLLAYRLFSSERFVLFPRRRFREWRRQH